MTQVAALSAPSLDPRALSGLRRYYNAKSLALANGASVSSWTDLSAQVDPAVQATGANQPIYNLTSANGFPGVTLDGVNDYLTFTRDATIKTAIVVLAMTNPQTCNYAPMIGDSSSFDLAGEVTTSPWTIDKATVPSAKLTAAVRVNGADAGPLAMQFRPSSLACVSIRFPTDQTAAFANIARDRVSSRNTKGVYAAVALYDRVLTDGEVAAVEHFLCSDFGIAWQGRPTVFGRASSVFLGDSLTDGLGSTGGNNYPNQTAALLVSNPIGVTKLGATGTTAQQWVDTYFDQYMNLNFTRVNRTLNQVGHLWLGTNDLYFGAAPSAIYANQKILTNRLRDLGFKVSTMTPLPRNNTGTPAGFESGRQELRTLMLSDPSAFDYLIDIGNDPTIGQAGQWADTTYYDVDKVHLNNAGYGVVAGYQPAAYTAFGYT